MTSEQFFEDVDVGGFSWYHGPTLAVINLANARGLENEMGKDI